MMKNTINSGSLQGLQAGQTLLLQARKVNGGKIQLMSTVSWDNLLTKNLLKGC